MRKGIYAIVKPQENGHVDIDLLFSNNMNLYTTKQAQDRSMMRSLTSNVDKMDADKSKFRYSTIDGTIYVDGVDDISTREEFVRTLGILSQATTKSKVEFYAYNKSEGEIVYTTDSALSLTRDAKKVVDFRVLNKKATESLLKSELAISSRVK